MPFDPNKHHRRSIRFKGYDYCSPGAYFITLCVHNRECLLGDVVDSRMRLNGIGNIVAEEWERSAMIRAEIRLDEWVIMPNHVHGIVMIVDLGATTGPVMPEDGTMDKGADGRVGTDGRPPLQRKPKSLGSLVAGFKSAVTTRINEWRGTPGLAVWQRGYYEHIIRDGRALNAIRHYIRDNPQRWGFDRDNTRNRRCLPPPIAIDDYLADMDETDPSVY